MYEYIASGVSCLVVLISIIVCVWMYQRNTKDVVLDIHRYDKELGPLSTSIEKEIQGLTIRQAADRLKKTRSHIRVLVLQQYTGVNPWSTNKGLLVVFKGSPAEKVTVFEVGRDEVVFAAGVFDTDSS